MRKFISPALSLFTIALLLLALSGCSPETKKNRYLEQADRSFSQGKYEEAEIDYKNVLKIEALNPQAISRLGIIYADQGRIGQALVYIVKGRELQPDNLELRLKYGTLSLANNNPKDARAEANYILDRRSQDPDAPLLLAATIGKPQDIAEVRARLTSLPAPAANGAPVLTALGLIELRQGHFKETEALLQKALAADPRYAAAHAALGAFYGLQKDIANADQSFKQAADLSPARSPRRIQYAQFKIQTGELETGKRYLEDLIRTTPDFLSAWFALAELAMGEKKFDACSGFLAKILARDPNHLEALFLRGRLLLAQGNATKAAEEFERLLKTYPQAPQVHYQLGLAHLASRDAAKATSSLKQALALSPSLVEASIALANLNLHTGDPAATILILKPLIQQRPENIQIRLLLAEAYRAQKKYEDALLVYRQVEKDFPGNAQTSLLTGLVQQQLNQPAKARQAFTEALARAPGLLPALEQLVALDIQDKQLDDATARLEAELIRNPQSAGVHLMRAKIALLKADPSRAESELQTAITLQPETYEAYYLLAQFYLSSNQAQKALANLQSIVSRNPGDVSALMLIGQIQAQQKNYPAARDAYEKLLAANPRFTAALNNLAYLYSEYLNEPEKAFAIAQKARELLPTEPHIADTLGWILFKKGQYRWALSLLEESVAKLPDYPTFHYHLGLARYFLGQEEPARLALQHALDLNKEFPEATEVKRRLALLAIDSRTAKADARSLLEKTLADHPGDTIALSRLAELQERDGDPNQAIATHLKSAQANPSIATPLLNLARLYAQGNDKAKALETAKAARKLAPDDPHVTRLLGRIAFQTGDYNWSASLLQEAARKISDDPALLYETAEALYSIGQVSEAEAFAREALKVSEANAAAPVTETPRPLFGQAEQASRFLELIVLSAKPEPTDISRVEELLKTEPDSVPALIALAAIQEKRADAAAAQNAYEKALARFPNFSPAKLRLAILGAAKPTYDEKAYDYAQQARTLYPNDPALARALGILLYRKGGDANRAVTLLKQSAATGTNDAELLYCLGLAQLQAKDRTGARQSLQKALEAGLSPNQAKEARDALSRLK